MEKSQDRFRVGANVAACKGILNVFMFVYPLWGEKSFSSELTIICEISLIVWGRVSVIFLLVL